MVKIPKIIEKFPLLTSDREPQLLPHFVPEQGLGAVLTIPVFVIYSLPDFIFLVRSFLRFNFLALDADSPIISSSWLSGLPSLVLELFF